MLTARSTATVKKERLAMQAARPLVFANKGMELNVNTHHFLRHEEQEFQMLPTPFKMIILE